MQARPSTLAVPQRPQPGDLKADCVLIATVAHERDSLADIVERLHEIGIDAPRQRVYRRVMLMRRDLAATGDTLPLAAARRERGDSRPNAGFIARSWAKHRL